MSNTNLSMLRLRMNFTPVNRDKFDKELSKFLDKKKEEIHNIFKTQVSPSITKTQSDVGFRGSDLGLTSAAPSKGKASLSKLNQALETAWKNKYQEYIENHKALPRSIPYEQTTWGRYKAANLNKTPGPWFSPSMPIRHTSHTLATGYLRDNISKAFKSRGNSLLKIDKSLAQIAWQFDIGASPDDYGKWFKIVSDHFEKNGVAPGADKFLDFSEADWGVVSGLVVSSLESGPVEDIIAALRNFNLTL